MCRQRFEGKVALVTGAGSDTGIGFATAHKLGSEGCRVAVTSTTERIFQRVSELRKLGIDAHGYVADLVDRPQVRRLYASLAQTLGAPHILVNNAGMVQWGSNRIPTAWPPSPNSPGTLPSTAISQLASMSPRKH